MIYSFDVFDTLITRRTAVPEGIFAIMQSDLGREEFESIPLPIRNNFYQLRIMAEKLARRSYQNDQIEDVTLEQIYEALAMRGELDAAQRKQLMCLECDIEYRECVPVEKNVARVKRLLSDGETVILISDMYLPKEQIYKMLEKAAPVLADLQMFVSGDCKKRKRTGAIYEFAMKQSDFTGVECIHTGDNERTDVDAAAKVGISSKLSWFPALLPIEKRLLEWTPSNVWINRIIGCSRRARLELGKTMLQKDEVLIGVSVGGVLLNSYVQWILGKAVVKGVKRLYFPAPDGYILKSVTDILIQRTGAAVETYYIHENDDTRQDMDFLDNRFALVAVSERKSHFQTFLFGMERITETNNQINYVFYPGRKCEIELLERICGIVQNRRDFLIGVEKFTEFFCENGIMSVQLEDMEQISKMINYIMAAPGEFLING